MNLLNSFFSVLLSVIYSFYFREKLTYLQSQVTYNYNLQSNDVFVSKNILDYIRSFFGHELAAKSRELYSCAQYKTTLQQGDQANLTEKDKTMLVPVTCANANKVSFVCNSWIKVSYPYLFLHGRADLGQCGTLAIQNHVK